MLLLLQNPTNPTDIFLKLLLSITIKSDAFVVHIYGKMAKRLIHGVVSSLDRPCD